jgi:hypothetical protein
MHLRYRSRRGPDDLRGGAMVPLICPRLLEVSLLGVTLLEVTLLEVNLLEVNLLEVTPRAATLDLGPPESWRPSRCRRCAERSA